MANPIEIKLTANATDVIREAKVAGNSFEDFGDTLNDVARDAQRTGDRIGDETRDGARQAENAIQRLEREFNDLATSAQRESRKAGDDIGDNVERGSGRAKESVREATSEGIQNFSEFASSTKGDMQSVADGVQGLTGGLASALPPLVGIPIAAIGALAAAGFQSAAEQAEKTKQLVQDAFDDMTESGNNYVSKEFLTSQLKTILDDTGLVELAKTQAKGLRLPYDTVIGALAGIPQSVALVNQAIDLSNAKIQTAADKGKGLTSTQIDQFTANQKLTEQINLQTGAYDTASGKASTFRNIVSGISNDSQIAAGNVGAVGSAINNIPSGKQVNIGVSAPGLADIERRVKNLGNGVNIPIGTIAGRFGRGEV